MYGTLESVAVLLRLRSRHYIIIIIIIIIIKKEIDIIQWLVCVIFCREHREFVGS